MTSGVDYLLSPSLPPLNSSYPPYPCWCPLRQAHLSLWMRPLPWPSRLCSTPHSTW